MHDAVFSLDNVHFRFPDSGQRTLDGISFEIFRGERVVITGPSGAGKSTLLYLLNRLYPLNCDGILSGSIKLFNKPSENYAPGEINRRIATVFQDPDSQFCMRTVEEELAFTLENLSAAAEAMDARIAGVLELTGLVELRHAVIQTLSGGMKQRVATACALIMEPEVLLLDEPLAHLDPFTAKQFVDWLSVLQKRQGLTVVAVEHRLELWETFFGREIILDRDGALIADVPFRPRSTYSFPVRPSVYEDVPALQAEAISVKKEGRLLLAPLSFKAARGEVVVIAGPNGSGKTTLLKALCGITPLTGGRIIAQKVGYVPQSPEFLFIESSVEAELAFSGASTQAEVEELMERLHLTDIKENHPFSVSHGQKRRVAIGAMLADKRDVLLMDEPTSGQDFAALMELFTLIRERVQEGATILIVTHDMEFAAGIADSVLLIKDGMLTGKFPAERVWADESLMQAHQLLLPKGMVQREKSFA